MRNLFCVSVVPNSLEHFSRNSAFQLEMYQKAELHEKCSMELGTTETQKFCGIAYRVRVGVNVRFRVKFTISYG